MYENTSSEKKEGNIQINEFLSFSYQFCPHDFFQKHWQVGYIEEKTLEYSVHKYII